MMAWIMGGDAIEFTRSVLLLLMLLNPFLVIVYLVDVVQNVDEPQFRRLMLRAGLIAGAVFCAFAVLGDAVFSSILQAHFASFQIFGGIVFLLIGIQFVFKGPAAVEILRGDSRDLAGAVAMPVLIGPGTISASVVIGKRLDPLPACGAVLCAVAASLVTMVILKAIHDIVRAQRESLVERYIEIAGRIMALYVGTISIEMVMQGLVTWSQQF